MGKKVSFSTKKIQNCPFLTNQEGGIWDKKFSKFLENYSAYWVIFDQIGGKIDSNPELLVKKY